MDQHVFERQNDLIERSGLGLLPGLGLALIVALFMIAAITLHAWWAVAIGLVGSLGGASVIVWIVLKTVLRDDE